MTLPTPTTDKTHAQSSSQSSSQSTPQSTPQLPSRAVLLTATAAIASSAAFAAGCLLTQIATVPTWQAMEPTTFLELFATSGPATGAVLFPIEVVAVALLATTTYLINRQRRPGRLAWAVATAAMSATVILLPVYFAGANVALLDPTFPPGDVADAVSSWNAWNWLRTGLAATATAAAGTGLAATLRTRSHA